VSYVGQLNELYGSVELLLASAGRECGRKGVGIPGTGCGWNLEVCNGSLSCRNKMSHCWSFHRKDSSVILRIFHWMLLTMA